jgi:hypothetical protein
MGKFAEGARVRVMPKDGAIDPYSKVWQYANLEGKVVRSISVASQRTGSCNVDPSSGPFEALKEEYTVRLDIGIEIDHVSEECLEKV